jgi:hypothetical protein
MHILHCLKENELFASSVVRLTLFSRRLALESSIHNISARNQ